MLTARALGWLTVGLSSLLRAQAPPTQSATALDAALRAQVDSGFAGVVLVAQHDTVVLRQAYGRGRERPSVRSAFWIASVTKSFTAAVIVTLQRDGRLSVQDSLGHYFPSAPPDKRSITIQQLLTHTAGFGGTYTAGGLTSRAAAVRGILRQPLAYPPGSGYRYGDDDYALLAAIIEVVTGRPWERVVAERLLGPMGLAHTGFWCERRRGLPRPIAGSNGDRSSCTSAGGDWGHRGANGMFATVDDVWTWCRTIGTGSRDRGAFAEITTPYVDVRGEGTRRVFAGYGTRLYVEHGQIVELVHAGSGDDGHTVMVRQLPAGLTIIVMSNAGAHRGTTWSAFIASVLASTLAYAG
jgi:CubicO group peptidase (beta-lactamase class C family)